MSGPGLGATNIWSALAASALTTIGNSMAQKQQQAAAEQQAAQQQAAAAAAVPTPEQAAVAKMQKEAKAEEPGAMATYWPLIAVGGLGLVAVIGVFALRRKAS
jgi:hypothetical protein